jgi:hypothetical protein
MQPQHPARRQGIYDAQMTFAVTRITYETVAYKWLQKVFNHISQFIG